jgi:hypothetical protein
MHPFVHLSFSSLCLHASICSSQFLLSLFACIHASSFVAAYLPPMSRMMAPASTGIFVQFTGFQIYGDLASTGVD